MNTTTENPIRGKYRAVQAIAPGKLELIEKPLMEPPTGFVRIKVEACGVCHSDSAPVEGGFPINRPCVPGHEVVGVIDKLGEDVEGWSVADRVGVGFLGWSRGHCGCCRGAILVNCQTQEYSRCTFQGDINGLVCQFCRSPKTAGFRANCVCHLCSRTVPHPGLRIAARPIAKRCTGSSSSSSRANRGIRKGNYDAVDNAGDQAPLGAN